MTKNEAEVKTGKIKAKKAAKIEAKKAAKAGAGKLPKSVKSVKVLTGSKLSGVGLTISEMSDIQFTGHLSRILNRMKVKGVSMESMKAASIRVRARRTEALAN